MVPALQVALIRAHQGDKAAEQAAQDTLAIVRSIFPANHIEVARGLTVLGRILILNGKSSEAIPLLREAYAIARKVFVKDNWRPAESRLFLGSALAMIERMEEARAELEAAHREMSAVLPATHPRVVEAARVREQCLAARAGQPCTL
jgi:Flp pilus assembly protein TadD